MDGLDTVLDILGWPAIGYGFLGIYHITFGRGPHWLVHGLLAAACVDLLFAIQDLHNENYISFIIDCVVCAMWVAAWWKHDGNDRWKKFKKKLTESIQQVGGKLKVVPNPA